MHQCQANLQRQREVKRAVPGYLLDMDMLALNSFDVKEDKTRTLRLEKSPEKIDWFRGLIMRYIAA